MLDKNFTFLLFILLVITRLYIQPLYSLISDCDETYNYWEPLNFLIRGFGKQTWEYSPVYSIRSWVFLLPFYSILYPMKSFIEKNALPTNTMFYAIRVFLGLISLYFERSLFKELKKHTSLVVANIWIFFQVFNPGWFHASVELLPSSFAMITYLGSIKYTLRYLSTKSERDFVLSLSFNFIGAIIGWPFVLISVVPLAVHYLISHRIIETLRASFTCMLVLLLIFCGVVGIDSIFYGKFTPVPWNIVMYNVINADEISGPNIFGVEVWYYYIMNLLLNFPLPVLFFFLLGLFHLTLWPLWSSLIIWISIFTAQPHKEERFMYPIYGLITLFASVGLSKTLRIIKCKWIRSITICVIFGAVIIQSASRILALTNNYTAPLNIYSQISSVSGKTVNVCTGREWYHYPSSFFLPNSHRLKFVQSNFDGLLPGDFPEDGNFLTNLRRHPEGMNNMNKFDPNKLVPLDSCTYYIDIVIPSDTINDAFNPINVLEEWEVLSCRPFVDLHNSKFLGRAFQLPEKLILYLPIKLRPFIDNYYKVNYVDYCLFGKKSDSKNYKSFYKRY